MGILLYIIAVVIWLVITPINWVIVAYKYGLSNQYFLETAIDLDKFGNRNFRTFLNATMVKNKVNFWNLDRDFIVQYYEFGDVRETISSALGKNKKQGTLTFFGKIICFILDSIDKNHCEKSIKNF